MGARHSKSDINKIYIKNGKQTARDALQSKYVFQGFAIGVGGFSQVFQA